MLHSIGAPGQDAELVRNAVRRLDPNIVVAEVRTRDQHLDFALARVRGAAILLSAVGVFGLVLAAIGVYGLLTSVVGGRTREIGVRVALGATPRSIMTLVLTRMAWVAGVLIERNCQGTMADALATWTMIEPDAASTDIVTALRESGVKCCLATNQEAFRAAYMSGSLEYAQLFDREFYSCWMGLAKPAEAYFTAILSELDVCPKNVLFIDDRQANLNAAREVGINAAIFEIDSGPAGLQQTLRLFGYRPSKHRLQPTAPGSECPSRSMSWPS